MSDRKTTPASTSDTFPSSSSDTSRPGISDTFQPGTDDVSPGCSDDVSPDVIGDSSRICGWCLKLLRTTARKDSKFCGRQCRQWAFRLRRRRTTEETHAQPMRFAYYDPPYPGCAWKYYRMPEVDHVSLIAGAIASGWDGWALSTSAKALPEILSLMPAGTTRICAWVKPHQPSAQTKGIHNSWEPLLVVGGRQRQPGKRDWMQALPARNGGTLPGRKPIAFVAWLYELLGGVPGDTLHEEFPGTGVVGRGWLHLSSGSAGNG